MAALPNKILLSIGLAFAIGIAPGVALAASPPQTVHYQGVLRDAAGNPRNGSFDMVFRFFNAANEELLVDRHLIVNAAAVSVNGGTFDVALGSGEILDGSGPGSYSSLADVFAAYADIRMEIQIGAEVLAPRVDVHAAPYALNAGKLDGKPAAAFLDTSATYQVKTGGMQINAASQPVYAGLQASSDWRGASFWNAFGSGYAEISDADVGLWATGNSYGAYFYDLDETGQAWLGFGNEGIRALGSTRGGSFENTVNSSSAELARDGGGLGTGIIAHGSLRGGYFEDLDSVAVAMLGGDGRGVEAYGSSAGGYFWESDTFAHAYLGRDGAGVDAIGTTSLGVVGTGVSGGGRFYDSDNSGNVWLGVGDTGVHAYGNIFGGIFENLVASGVVHLASGDIGARGWGNSAGGYFQDINSSGLAHVGYGDRGIWGKGTFSGGTFSAPDNVTFWADVATPTRKIVGTGTVSFVQNHPYDDSRSIVYAAPEGDEVATYTRGSGRLTDGVARIDLGPTFPLVTNPEYGLTAHLTSRDEAVVLVAETLSSKELVVRGPDGSQAGFDWIVYGLRLGFEDAAVVVPKRIDAFLPTAKLLADERGGLDAADSATGGARFRALEPTLGRAASAEPGEAAALRAAIEASAAGRLGEIDPSVERRISRPASPSPGAESETPGADLSQLRSESSERPAYPGRPGAAESRELDLALPDRRWRGADPVAVGAGVRIGDALAVDPGAPWRLVPVSFVSDRTIVGIAATEPWPAVDGGEQVEVATSGLVQARVDATYGAIAIGDLLVASATPGHLMRAAEAAQGTVAAKALEPLDHGAGEIRVLVMPR